MNRTRFSLEIFGDHFPWADNGSALYSDNSKQIERLKISLIKAIKSELTECQRTAVEEYYFNNKSVTQIAFEIGVNKSTVSRHLKRAREKLGQALKYGLFNIWTS